MNSGERVGFSSKPGSLLINPDASRAGEGTGMMRVLEELEGKIEEYSAKTREMLMRYSAKGGKRFVFAVENKDLNERIRTLHDGLDRAELRAALALKAVSEWRAKSDYQAMNSNPSKRNETSRIV